MSGQRDFSAHVWDDMLRLYAAPGIPALCLHLQDAHGVDVPLLLTLALADAAGIGAAPEQTDSLISDAAFWADTVVRPLRRIRQDLKPVAADPETSAFRDRVKALELESERQHVLRTAHALAGLTGPGDLAARYLQRCGLPGPEASAALTTLTKAIGTAVTSEIPARTE